jgi:ribosomal protein L12E/L44/L45/RPP1/RPP2
MELARDVFLGLSKECQAVAERGVRVSDECRRALETSVNALELVLNATKAPAVPPKAAASQMDEAPPPLTAACPANEECPVARGPSAVVAADDPSGDAALEMVLLPPRPDAAAGVELANKECSVGAQACPPVCPTAGDVASGGLLLSPARDAAEEAWLPGLSLADMADLFSSPVRTTYAPATGDCSIATLFEMSPTAEPWFLKEMEGGAPSKGLDAFMSSPALEEALRSAPSLSFGLFDSPGLGYDGATGMEVGGDGDEEEEEEEEEEDQKQESPDITDVPLEELSRKQLLDLAKKVTGRDYKTANYGRRRIIRLLLSRM